MRGPAPTREARAERHDLGSTPSPRSIFDPKEQPMFNDACWLIWRLAILSAIVWLIATKAPGALVGFLLALLVLDLPAARRS